MGTRPGLSKTGGRPQSGRLPSAPDLCKFPTNGGFRLPARGFGYQKLRIGREIWIPQRHAPAQTMRQLLEIHPAGAIARPAFLRRNGRGTCRQCSAHLLQLCPSRHLLGE